VGRVNLAHRVTRAQDRLLDRLRDPRADEAARRSGTAETFDALQSAEYALIVTFRRSGDPVATPMWFGLHVGRVYVRSLGDAGKVKRLRNDPHIRLAPCRLRGTPTGRFAEGVGRILPAEETEVAEAALDRHYGMRRRLYEGLGSMLGVRTVYIEMTPTTGTFEGPAA
jgi:PPOX class probable F420-dependent enzyme